jgi:hypothetical protein
MQKAGTGFFYECLQNMQSFRLSLCKEIHHFDKYGSVHARGVRLLEKAALQMKIDTSSAASMQHGFASTKVKWPVKGKIQLGGRRHELDQPNLEFLKNFSIYVNGGADDGAYLDLFTPYKDYLSGEITPAYSTLDSEAIRHVHELIPAVKIILCVREPIGRLWSQMNMRVRSDFLREHKRQPGRGDLEEFSHLLRSERLQRMAHEQRFMKRSLATRVYQKWIDVFGEENLLVIHFKDLIGKTGQVLDKTCDFLGAQRQENKKLPANRKEKALKIPLDDARREVLQQALHEEVENFARVFENHRDRV